MLTFEMIKAAYDKCQNEGMKREPPVISWKAHSMLQRIYTVFPNFRFSTEYEIWWKAHEMGLQ